MPGTVFLNPPEVVTYHSQLARRPCLHPFIDLISLLSSTSPVNSIVASVLATAILYWSYINSQFIFLEITVRRIGLKDVQIVLDNGDNWYLQPLQLECHIFLPNQSVTLVFFI